MYYRTEGVGTRLFIFNVFYQEAKIDRPGNAYLFVTKGVRYVVGRRLGLIL